MITIAIDGPSAAGKGVVSEKISKLLNIHHLDTGAIYRAIGLYCYENNVDAHDEEQVKKILDKIEIKIEFINGEQYTYLNGECINGKIRSSIVSDYASRSSALLCVREKVKDLQQDFAKHHSVVMEGRDITTEILPNAKYKFYLTASPEVRAERRLQQHKESGENVGYEEVLQNIIMRDFEDANRKISPLKPAEDAVIIDTSHTTLQDTSKKIYGLVFNKMQQILNSNSDIEVSENLITLNSEKQM